MSTRRNPGRKAEMKIEFDRECRMSPAIHLTAENDAERAVISGLVDQLKGWRETMWAEFIDAGSERFPGVTVAVAEDDSKREW